MNSVETNDSTCLAVIGNEVKHHTKQLDALNKQVEALLAKKTDWKLVMMVVGAVMGLVVPAMGTAVAWVHSDVKATIEHYQLERQAETYEQNLRIQKIESYLELTEGKGHGK